MIVCHCKGVSDREIRTAVRDGASTLSEIQKKTRACTGCESCEELVLEVLEGELSKGDPQRK